MSSSSSVASSSIPSQPALPQSLARLQPHLRTVETVKELFESIQREVPFTEGKNSYDMKKVRWATRYPLLARNLCQTLIFDKRLRTALPPLFSMCFEDPDLKKAMIGVLSAEETKDSKAIEKSLRANIAVIASQPDLFFRICFDLLKAKKYSLLSICTQYWSEHPELFASLADPFLSFSANHCQTFLSHVLSRDDHLVLGDLIDKGIHTFDEVKKRIELGNLQIHKSKRCIELYIKRGMLEGAEAHIGWDKSETEIEATLLNLSACNGAKVSKPNPYSTNYSKTRYRWERGRELYKLYQAVHADGNIEEFLSTQKREHLWIWLTLDARAHEVLPKAPQFFQKLLLEGPPESIHPDYNSILMGFERAALFQPERDGTTLLSLAIEAKNSALALAIISAGVPPNAPLPSGLHPLEAVAYSDLTQREQILKALLAQGGKVSECKRLSLLNLFLQSKGEDLSVLKLLVCNSIPLSERADDQETLFHKLIHRYAETREPELLELLIAMGIADSEDVRFWTNSRGNTPLKLANELNLPEVALILLQNGCALTSSSSSSSEPHGESSLPLFELLETTSSSSSPGQSSERAKILTAYSKKPSPFSFEELAKSLNLVKLGHLFGDAILKKQVSKKGKQLEGMTFNESLEFLVSLLDLAGEGNPALNAARRRIEKSIPLCKLLNYCHSDDSFRNKYIPILTAILQSEIEALTPGSGIVIPFGWIGKERNAHAMLIEISKNPDGNLSLSVINTGDGLRFHQKKPTGLKDLINPLLQFTLTEEQLTQTDLIPSILYPQAYLPEDKLNQFSSKDIYQLLFSRLTPSPLSDEKNGCLITAQKSGTCSLRVGLTYLHAALGTKEYKKIKIKLDQLVFQAIQQLDLQERASLDPAFIRLFEHAIERSALNALKSIDGSEESLAIAEHSSALFDAVQLPESEREEHIPSLEIAPPNDDLSLEISRVREGSLPIRIENPDPILPTPILTPPNVDFSHLGTIGEWQVALGRLIAYFEASKNNPLDPAQSVPMHLATQALQTMPLPDTSLFVNASVEEKRGLKGQLKKLAELYAHSTYIHRQTAQAAEELRVGYNYGNDHQLTQEAESLEQYLGINKLYAHFWELSLSLEGAEEGPQSLKHYRIDISHLIALRKSLHLPAHSFKAIEELNALIAFFEKDSTRPETLLKISAWSTSSNEMEFPFQNARGEQLLFDAHYSEIPETAWSSIDHDRERLNDNRTKPDLKEWRLAHLFTHVHNPGGASSSSELNLLSETLQLYTDLREMALICHLFKVAPQNPPVKFKSIEWKQGRIQTGIQSFPQRWELEKKAREAGNESTVGNFSHRPVGARSALSVRAEQNQYTLDSRKEIRHFYDITSANELSLHRLIAHFQDHLLTLSNKDNQTIFQLVLFGKNRPKDSKLEKKAAELIAQALTEFEYQYQTNSANQEILNAIIFLCHMQLRLGGDRGKIQAKVEKLLEIAPPVMGERTEEKSEICSNQVQLHYLWICAQTAESLSDPLTSASAFAHLVQAKKFTSQIHPHYGFPDPSIEELANRTLFQHLEQLKGACESGHGLRSAAKAAFSVVGIQISEETPIEGEFPQASVVLNGHLYEVHFLSGKILRDKIGLESPSLFRGNSIINQFSDDRKYRIETSKIASREGGSTSFGIANGNHYEITTQCNKENKIETHIVWHRATGTLIYVPHELTLDEYYAQQNKIPKTLHRIAVSSPPRERNYSYWVSQEAGSPVTAIIENKKEGIEEVVIYSDGTASRYGKEGRWNYQCVETVPEIANLANIQPKEQIGVWQSAENSDYREVICHSLQDDEGIPLTFQSDPVTHRLNLLNLPGYFLSSDQKIKGFRSHFPYVILENEKGAKKAIFSMRGWSEISNPPKNFERSYQCAVIDIDSQGFPAPINSEQHLMLAYQFIGAKQHERALQHLEKAESSRAYNPRELQLFGWIFLHHKETKDHSPRALSLRIIAAHMVQSNLQNYPETKAERIQTIDNLYDPPHHWISFWKGVANFGKEKSSNHHYLARALSQYYEVTSHCKGRFQVHEKRLTPFEEAEWLNQICAKVPIPNLLHRLQFLAKGSVEEVFENVTLESRESLPSLTPKPTLEWIHSVVYNPEVLNTLPRVRPEQKFERKFGELYALTQKGTEKEKQRLFWFLKDMLHDPKKENQIIRAILLSQLPPYNTHPKSKEIAENIDRIAAKRNGPNGLEKYESWKYSDYESKLLSSLEVWHQTQFPLQASPAPKSIPHVETNNLLPPLPQSKKEALSLNSLEREELAFSKLNGIANECFTAEENPSSTTILPPLPSRLNQHAYFRSRGEDLRLDVQVGAELNQSRKRFKLKEKIALHPLRETLQETHSALQAEANAQRVELEEFLHTVRGGRERAIEAQLMRQGKKQLPPTLDECIALFIQKDLELYRKRMPFFDEGDCIELHEKIGRYLQKATEAQSVERALAQLAKAIKNQTKGQNSEQPLHQLAVEMHKKREYNPAAHPELMVFEYYSKLSLRSEQCANIAKMTTPDPSGKFPPLLLQMIMSGGKTFVLGTLLSLMKADGYHLSLLFTPRAQLDTNVSDMKERTQTFFGTRGHTLHFNRGKGYFNVSYLRNMHHLLLNAISKREYLILAPETLLSMQNQFIEAREKIHALRRKQELAANPHEFQKLAEEIQQWQEPAQELKKILRLIRERGAATFDEIDTLYSPRRELNYPGVETSRLDQISIKLVGALYEIASTDPELKANGLDLHANTQSHLTTEKVKSVKELLIRKTLKLISENLYWSHHLGLGIPADPAKLEEYAAYLVSPHLDAPDWIAQLENSQHETDRMSAERLILIRQEIVEWLPACWKCSADEHFIRSKEHPEYLAAKPTICANIPNENAEIAHCWELVNKTLQLYVANGIDFEQTKTIVLSLQKTALIQKRGLGPEAQVSETEAASLFERATGKKLSEIHTQDRTSLLEIQQSLNSGTADSLKILIDYLTEQVMPKLTFHTEQIHNNALNLSSAVSSEQGYSGTTDNLYIFSHLFLQNIAERVSLDRGAMGKVIDILSRANRRLHRTSSAFNTPESLMQHLHASKPTEERNQFHAFIDVGAYFKGLSNAAAAQSFLRYFSNCAETPIEGILYYDDTTNQLACLKKGHESRPIFINSTDRKGIYAATGLKQEQLFVFFDSSHTVGSNILQPSHAKAFYTVGSQTALRDILQGVMRQRGLLESQQVEGIIPEDLVPLISDLIEREVGDTLSIEDLLLFTEVNGLLRDQEDNLKAFPLKLTAAIRKHVLDHLYLCDNPEEEEIVYAAAREFFVKSMSQELFRIYSKAPQEVDIDSYIAIQMDGFRAKLRNLLPRLPTAHLLEQELDEISALAKGYLPSRTETRASISDTSVEKVSDIDQDIDQMSALDLETQRDLRTQQRLTPAIESEWDFSSNAALIAQLESTQREPLCQVMLTIEHQALFSDCFSPEFLISKNYLRTEEAQNNLFDKHQKTPYEAILFQDTQGRFHLMVVSTKEAQQFAEYIQKSENPLPIWIINPLGENPLPEPHPAVDRLLVEFLFFSGRLSALEKKELAPALESYLQENRPLKKDLFETTLLDPRLLVQYEYGPLAAHLNAPALIRESRDSLTSLKNALFSISQNRFAKCSTIVDQFFASSEGITPETFPILLNIATTALLNRKTEAWGSELLSKVLPQTSHLQMVEKLTETLKLHLPQRAKMQILDHLLDLPEIPLELKLRLFLNATQMRIDSKTGKEPIAQALKQILELLSRYQNLPNFAAYIEVSAKMIASLPETENLFDAIMDLCEDSTKLELVESIALPYLRKSFSKISQCRISHLPLELIGAQLRGEGLRAVRLYANLKEKYYGKSAQIDQCIHEHLLDPIAQKAHYSEYGSDNYMESKPNFSGYEQFTSALRKTNIDYAIEKAENIDLKFNCPKSQADYF